MRVLVLGGTGAMGSHLCRLLVDRGFDVTCTTRKSNNRAIVGVTYAVGSAKDEAFLENLLRDRWGAIIDFMIWSTDEFSSRYQAFLRSTEQYVFVSSYRVYADSELLLEDSPRLLDVVGDSEYLKTDEYALSKARCEDLLSESESENWTIVRPAITYDGCKGRIQLGVYEMRDWLWRAKRGLPIPFPVQMMSKQATMSFGGDIALMIACLIGNEKAKKETFIVSGSDHMTWSQVIDVYKTVVPFEIVACDIEDFAKARGGVYQIRYDRMFNRVIDNSKILTVTGLPDESLTIMKEGLQRELEIYISEVKEIPFSAGFQGRLDGLCGGIPSCGAVAKEGGIIAVGKYFVRRIFG